MGIACGKSSLTLNNINMAPKNILITGGNRGIGLQLVKEFLKTSPDHLFATCRDPSKADDLNALAKDNPNLHVLKLEVTDHSAYQGIADKVGKYV